ncbi:MAG: diguanylate cyclase [Bacillota bacterium]|nr:diguanylate cyclase [Bacillota bacterium]
MLTDNNIDILLVDDRVENLLVLEGILDGMEVNIMKATSGNDALALMLEHNFALVLLDVQMPDMNGFEIAELMRCSQKTRQIPIIFITAISKEKHCIFKGYEVGAVDYLFKPVEPIILRSKVSVFIELHKQKLQLQTQAEILEEKIRELLELRETNWKLEKLSSMDGLTGINNRRSFNDHLRFSVNCAQNRNEALSLIMIDIDFFKAFNDNYGHLKGDECLIRVAKAISKAIRINVDFAARYGGEEFIIISPGTSISEALALGEKIRKCVENEHIIHDFSGAAAYVTVSVGVTTTFPSGENKIENIVGYADRALYEAKQSGRNRVVSIKK